MSNPPSQGMHLCTCAPLKIYLQVLKNSKIVEITFFIKKSEKQFGKLTFGNSEFTECQI